MLSSFALNQNDFSDFVQNAIVPLHCLDEEGIILWANQAELDYMGYTASEYIGKPIRQFHADPPVIEDILRRLRNDETLHNYRARLFGKNGIIRHVMISSKAPRTTNMFLLPSRYLNSSSEELPCKMVKPILV